ncbi:COG4-domain-containing protein [Obba rivulosa]|uniref:Conserved oligomeric Golgi complex subunit 4 n=1 Tax=Obba rivulosa TaxID=1052685 RepID=A0A8E2DT72_9APHY|nr:COG4-domain-containing protein [Obba rivulosa]
MATISQPTRPDARTLATLPDILSCLSSLESEEAELSTSLSELLAAREPIVNSLARLQSLVPQLDNLSTEARGLHGTVAVTARTAENVGGRVRALDEEMRRVREAAERVGQVMELKASLSALQEAMAQKDWESATRHCARAMALPLEVIQGRFAETTVPTEENPLPPAETLQDARERLLAIFRREFESASQSRDAAATSRFFKLFPAIGWEEEGLQVYANFVVDLVRVRPPASAKTSSPLYYIAALTTLFESIAKIVDQHQPVVEKYYGPGRMSRVLERLLQECDRVAKDLLEGWEEARAMKRKLSDTVNSGSHFSSSPTTRRQPSQPGTVDEDTVDPREIDKVLTEIAGISSRWALFRKFMYGRLKEFSNEDEEDESADGSGGEPDSTEASQHPLASTKPTAEAIEVLEKSSSQKLFDDILTTYYVPLEVWYARTIIDRAHRLSNPDISQSPAMTTTPDDAFYILKAVLMRMVSTGSTTVAERTSEQLREVMDREYVGIIKRKLDDVYRTGGSIGPGVRGEKVERENRQSFIMLLNDLDISSSHMERLVKDICSSAAVGQNYIDADVEAVKSSISSLTTLVPKFRSTLRAGVEQLFNQLMRPKMRTFVIDVYKDVSYVLDEESYAAANYQDLVRKRYIKAWESLVDGYKDIFTESNYRLFFGLAIDVLVRPWEKFVLSLKYSELGAIRFDHDLRSITTYLSSQTVFGDIREKFVRLQQISMVLNLDSEEDVDEFYNGSGIAWQLTEQEVRSIANLRV